MPAPETTSRWRRVPRRSARFANALREIADWLDPWGSGDPDKIHAAGEAAMERLNKGFDEYQAKLRRTNG